MEKVVGWVRSLFGTDKREEPTPRKEPERQAYTGSEPYEGRPEKSDREHRQRLNRNGPPKRRENLPASGDEWRPGD